MKYIKNFTELSIEDKNIAGGKGASLGEMVQAGINVPPGFVVLTNACKEFSNSEFSKDFEEELFIAFDTLGADRVAVRSSAIAEDSKTASWAGQLESFLNVKKDSLVQAIRDCWKSILSERAVEYASHQNVGKDDLTVAVVIQKMVNSEISGVMFSVNPINNNHNEVMIEATFGLGEMLVQGMVTPDNYVANKSDGEIIEKFIQSKTREYVYRDGDNVEIDVDPAKAGTATLDEEFVQRLVLEAKKIEDHYGDPQDIEWGIEENDIYILQARPIIGLHN